MDIDASRTHIEHVSDNLYGVFYSFPIPHGSNT